MYKILFVYVFIIICFGIEAQYAITGVVQNKNGESIEFASVFLEETTYATISDEDGLYKISEVKPGKYSLKCTFLGYEPVVIPIDIIDQDLQLDIQLIGEVYQLDKIEIIANRVDKDDAFTYTNVDKEELTRWNNGQDMPYLLRFTPSLTVTSDAGNGVGYTGVRLRGTDASRINVTINGIPVNDAESQGVFWVNMPDFGSSVENIQIQRGVGTSTSGVGAFGGTISLNTKAANINPYASATLGLGSFATNRISLKLGTGLINDKYSIDLRYSSINSDGYIDRASSKLRSLFFGASRLGETSSTRLQIISGSEVTYQAWYGVPESKLTGSSEALQSHYFNNLGAIYNTKADSINLFTSDRKYNYYLYENQVDDYQQTHVQLHDNRKLSENFVLNTALNFTHGSGFFEEYKVDQNLGDYNITQPGASDLIRRRWLDNNFYGGNVNLHYNSSSRKMIFGISAFQYDGDHFGKVVEVESIPDFTPGDTYYFNVGNKTDLSAFAKSNVDITEKLSFLVDLQLRRINYTVQGNDNDGLMLDFGVDFSFFNPKVGLNVDLDNQSSLYASLAVANKEPSRSDFVDHPLSTRPSREKLYDLEMGYKYNTRHLFGEIVLYNMHYKDQLVLTGALNDVGSPLRTNVPESYRRGLEINLNSEIENLKIGLTATFSSNKIKEFTEVLYDYTDGFQEIKNNYRNVDIAFSPEMLFTAQLGYSFSKGLGVTLSNQYVSEQFMDNTSNENRKLDDYFVSDIMIQYTPEISFTQNMQLKAEVRNIFGRKYASNGYTYSYIYGDLITENFFYPQAERNFMLTLLMYFGK